MNEIQRQAYLSALGIDNYMPRLLLQEAPEPIVCDIPAHVPEASLVQSTVNLAPSTLPSPVVESGPVVEPTLTANADKAAGEVLKELGLSKSIKKSKSAEAERPQPASAQGQIAPERFSLTIWRISQDLMIIDTRDIQAALPTDRLLANMLNALGYHLSALPKANVLKWPIMENDFTEQGPEQAREMLHAFLDAELLLDPVKHLWLMGEAAAAHILPEGKTYTNLLETPEALALEQLATPLIVTPSLVDMLRTPALKAQAWRAIQPLRIRR